MLNTQPPFNRAQRRMAKKATRHKVRAPRAFIPPTLDCWEQFDSIERLFSQLKAGAVEVESSMITIMGLHGERYAVLPALEGWITYWHTLATRHGIPYNDTAMRKLAKSLEYDKPLQMAEVEAAYQVVELQRRMFRVLPRKEVAAVAKEVMHDIRVTDEIKGLMGWLYEEK